MKTLVRFPFVVILLTVGLLLSIVVSGRDKVVFAQNLSLSWPVQNYKVTQNYDIEAHPALDMINTQNRVNPPVLAAADGLVTHVGYRSGDPMGGYEIAIHHDTTAGGKYYTWYAHLKHNSATVAVGHRVVKGQTIAIMGNTSSIPNLAVHLHFVLNTSGSSILTGAIDPLPYLTGSSPPQPPSPPSPPPVPNITQVGRYIPTTYNPPNNGTPRFEITLKNNSPYEAHLKEVFLRLRHTNGTTVQVPFWSRSSNMLIIPPGGTWVFRTHSPPLPGRGLWEVHKVEMLHASDTWLQGIAQNGWLMVHEANYALNRPVFVHTVREGSGNTPQRVNDGSPLTRWESEWYDNQMIEIDLGQTRTIDTVMLHWESAYAKVFRVKIGSNCGSSPHQCTWTQVYSTSNGKGGDSAITFNEINGRWVKIELVQRGTPWGFSLWEFGVYNRYTG